MQIAAPIKRIAHSLPLPHFIALLLLIGLSAGIVVTAIVADRRRASNEVIVSLNGVSITAPAFYRRLDTRIGRTVVTSLTNEALALKFAEASASLPSAAALDARVRQKRQLQGFAAFEAQRHLSEEDVRQMCRLELAQELSGHDRIGFDEFRKHARLEIFAKQYRDDTNGRSCGKREIIDF